MIELSREEVADLIHTLNGGTSLIGGSISLFRLNNEEYTIERVLNNAENAIERIRKVSKILEDKYLETRE